MRKRSLAAASTEPEAAASSSPEPGAYVNAIWLGSKVALLHRDPSGQLQKREVPAEHCCHLRLEDWSPELETQIRRHPGVRGFKVEGQWVRLTFRDRDACRDLCQRGGYFELSSIPTFEADLHPTRRWLAEHPEVQIQRPRRGFLDLESDSRVPFERLEEARILIAGYLDAETGVFWQGVLEEDTDAAECELLAQLWEQLGGVDQVAVWAGSAHSFQKGRRPGVGIFDVDLLLARTARYSAQLRVEPRRWLWISHLEAYAKMNMSAAGSGEEKQSLALNAVARSLGLAGKEDFDASKMYEAWLGNGPDLDRACSYNERDVRVMLEIEQKKPYLDLITSVCIACGVFPDHRGMNGTAYVESFILRLSNARGFHWKSHWGYRPSEPFEGAFVLEPKQLGVQRHVHVCDFASLYPSIIQTWNLSPETHAPEHKLVKEQARPAYLAHLPPVVQPIPLGHCRAPNTGETFRVDVVGMLPIAVTELRRLRQFHTDEAKKHPPGTPEHLFHKNLADGFKICVNTFYGVAGSPFSRFFERAVAESTSTTGAWLIKHVMREAEARGWRIQAGDSVTGDRVLVVRDPGRRVRMVEASDLWAASTARTEPLGGKEHAALPGWEALTEQGWRPILGAMRHAAGKRLWRVSTKHGQTEVTSDHGIMVDGVETTPEEFVAKGARFTCVPAPTPQPPAVVDLWDHVGDFVDRYDSPRSGVVELRFARLGEDSLVLLGWGESKVRVRRFYRKGSPELQALLRLVGAYASDGSASLRGGSHAARYLLSFCKARHEVVSQVAADLATIATGMTVTGPFWTETVYVVRSGTSALACLFAALCGCKSRGKRLPSFAFDLCEVDAGHLLGALADGDGYVDDRGRLESYTTNSAQLAAGVSYFFDQQGISHGWSYRESKGAWTLKVRKAGRETKLYAVRARTRDPEAGEYVYDLTVEGAHTFVDGIGRVLLHNTDSAFIVGCTQQEFQDFVGWLNDVRLPQLIAEQGCVRNELKLEAEKGFDVLVTVAKKRYCNPPEAPILTNEGFVPLSEIEVGQTIVGWENGRWGKRDRRRLIESKVVAIHRHYAPIVKVTFESGRTLRCTADHNWLRYKQLRPVGPSGKRYHYQWTKPKVGIDLARVVDVPRELSVEERVAAAWLGGIFDGEGSLSGQDRAQIVIAQSRAKNREVCLRIEEVLALLGISYSIYGRSSNCQSYAIRGGRQARLDFMTWCKPAKVHRFPGLVLGSSFAKPDRVVDIEPDGEGEVIGLTTTTGNYIAWGFASKNCGRFSYYKGKPAVAESKPEVKGLEYKRGDTVRLARDLQKEVLDRLICLDRFPVPVELPYQASDFQALAELWRTRVTKGAIDPEDYIVTKSLGQPLSTYRVVQKKDGSDAALPAHVEVAKRMKASGMNVTEGTRIAYVVVDGSASPQKTVGLWEFEPGMEDRHYLWETQVWPPTHRVLEACFPEHDWKPLARSRPYRGKAPKHGGAGDGQRGLPGVVDDLPVSK